jgi:PKD-like domain/Secretion system C-terminal sorting domain/NHL repeat
MYRYCPLAKTLNIFYVTFLVLLHVNTQSFAQNAVTVTTDGKCEGATLYANTTGGAIEQLRWQWKSRNDSIVGTSTRSPVYDSATTVAGGNGAGDNSNQIDGPWGFCVDKYGNVYIADTYNHRVQKWAPSSTEGITVAGGNGRGKAANQFDQPFDVKVDDAGNIYVADNVNCRVQKWLPGAIEGITVAGGNGVGSKPNQFNEATAICLDKNGALYIADKQNSRIQKWIEGATEGITVAGGNGEGNRNDQTAWPTGVFVDTTGNIYVTGDGYYTNRVQKWAPGAKEGITVSGGILEGRGSTQLNQPKNIFVDHLGSLYIADNLNNRIQKYLPGSDTGITVAGEIHSGSTPVRLNKPKAVWVVGDTIYVCDQLNDRVQMFLPKGEGPVLENSFKPTNGGNYTAMAVFKQNHTPVTSDDVHLKGLPRFKVINGQKRNLCGGGNFVYSADALGQADSYNWLAPEGCSIVSGQGTAAVTISIPANFSKGVIAVSASNSCGSGPVFYDTLTTKPLQPDAISGPAVVTTYDTFYYVVDPAPGISYKWEIPVAGVVIVSGQNTNAITVVWNSFESGNVIAKATACNGGTAATSRLFVTRVLGIAKAADTDALNVKAVGSYLRIYPNPANDKATIAFIASGTYTLQVRDVAGKLLWSQKAVAVKGENRVDIDISRFGKGNYFVTVLDNVGKKVVQLSKQ